MTDITIPPEALEEAAKHLPYSQLFEVHAACLAMLRAWETDTHRMIVGTALDEVGGTYPAIILPLPKEPSDD